MSDRLFDIVPLSDGPKSASTSHFAYLQSSARPEAAEARSTLERWFSRYPKAHRHGLRQRFRAREESSHSSASFELALHEYLLCCGAKCIEVEPQLAAVAAKPDFRVTWPDDTQTIVEAILATGSTRSDDGLKRNAETLIDRLRQLRSLDYYVEVDILTPVLSLTGIRSVCAEVDKFLHSLDYNGVEEGFPFRTGRRSKLRRDFTFTVERPKFRLEITAIPKGEQRGKSSKCVAFWHSSHDTGWSSTQQDIRDAIAEKANKYGELGCRFAVAINVFDWGLEQDDVVHAVLGSMTVKMTIDERSMKTVSSDLVYGADGAFGDPTSPWRRRVSGVLCANHWSAWNSPERRLYVAHNPWATFRLPADQFLGLNIQFDETGQPNTCGSADVTGVLPRIV